VCRIQGCSQLCKKKRKEEGVHILNAGMWAGKYRIQGGR
jgi:hypothetical protein